MKTSTLIALLASLCMAAAFIETSYEVYTVPLLYGFLRNDTNSSIIPPDDNSGSYGDLFHSTKRNGDELLHRETFVNYNASKFEEIVFWYGRFNTSCVTHVRSLNFGRERAWTKSIDVSGHSNVIVEINLLIPSNKTVRLFFEVYGYARLHNSTCVNHNNTVDY